MRDQIIALENLQKVDIELREIETGLEHYPKEISNFNNELKEDRETIESLKKELEQIIHNKDPLDSELAKNEEIMKQSEERLFEIKTHKEYVALQKEISEIKVQNSDLEEKILSLMEQIEELEKNLNEKEKTLSNKETEYGEKINEYNQKIGELKKVYEPMTQEKEKYISKVKKEVLPIYNRLTKRNGIALAQVKDEICMGCNMNIPPQLFNEVLTLSKIIQCPSCQKILYRVEKETNQ